MTDSSYKARSNGERPVQTEDDPLMQLSQIGGFEELFSAQSTHQDTPSSDEMFAIDLERELVGELDDDFFGQDMPDVDVPDVFAEVPAPQPVPVVPSVSAEAADNYRESYRSVTARSYASHNQGSHGYGSLTQHLQSQSTTSSTESAGEADTFDASAEYTTTETPEPFSYAEHGFNAALEDELALALSGNEDVLTKHYGSEQSPDQHHYEAEPQHTGNAQDVYTPPAAAVPALSLEDELENLLFGDTAPVAHEEAAPVYAPEQPEQTEAVDDFAAQSSIEGGANQPSFKQPAYDEPSIEEGPVLAAAPYSGDEPPQDMFFDDASFAVEPSDIELNALNQASAEFEATLADLPSEETFELDDENFSDAIERELSAQNYFAWEKDKVQPDDAAADGQDEAFFSEQDFDFSVDDAQKNESFEETKVPLTFAHEISENARQAEPFPHYASQRSGFNAPAPDVATMSVSEAKVEQTQPLDLPEVAYYNEPENAGMNQLEAEFADVFSSINVEETQPAPEDSSSADRAFDDIFRENYAEFAPSNATLVTGGIAAGAAAAAGNQDDFYNHWADGKKGAVNATPTTRSPYGEGEDLGAAADAYRERPVRGRRGMLLATAAGALVLIGGIAYHFIGGGITSGDPVIIRSDNEPVKLQPENPGGAVVPNQDKAVYERVAGTIPQNPEQKSLVSAQETPVDLAATEDEFGSIDEERNDTITATSTAEEAPLIPSRTVQTMVVRADGTIVPPSAETSRPVTPVAPDTEELTPENIIESSPLVPAEATNTLSSAPVAPARPVETQTFTPPAQVPVAPSRPAQQPTTVVASVPPATPAASAPAAAAAGEYFIQIASQPSAELAQKSFANMGQKYANIIGGRSVDIRKADIPNKGTYYRVRIAAGSKADANSLCERLKSAGGSCFVTR